MANYLIAVGGILLVLLGWVWVQYLAREFARRHPQFGPAREEGGGCGRDCSCSSQAHCTRRQEAHNP